MQDKHMADHKALEAFDGDGCPVCNLVDQSVRERVKWMLYESVNDPKIRDRIRASRGFCREHGEDLLELGHPLGVAIIYYDILESVTHDMKSPRAKWLKPKPKMKCPGCEWAESYERQYLSVLVKQFNEPEMHDRLLGCRTICIPHTEKLIEMLPSGARQEFLKAVSAHIADLNAELLEIVRKSDYRCNEPWGSEADAWQRALKKVIGL